MKVTILNRRDSIAGLFFILLGLAGSHTASGYPLGSAMRMGAGYFPLLLGAVLAVLGAIVLIRSVRVTDDEPADDDGFALRPAVLVGAGVIVFALVVQQLGLVLATVALTLVSGHAHREVRFGELLGLSAVLSAFGVAVFAYGLGVPLPVGPA